MTGEGAVTSYAQAQGDGHTWPSPEPLEDEPMEDDEVRVVARQEQGTVSTQEADVFDVSGTAPLGADVQEGETDDINLLARGPTAEIEYTSRESEEMPPPRITRPIPPPPVNLRSKPTPPSSPPLSPPPKTPLRALRVDEEECPSSPDIPPRPVPPPGRSGTCRGLGTVLG